ncbi:MAG: hypothetical protein OEV94_11740 [Deltaproteobacteria bacterium]|nr:hypothetical protein [Deltaproteobacteria bacterium]
MQRNQDALMIGGLFTEGNPAAIPPIPASPVHQDFLNDIQEELVGVLEAQGINPAAATRTQIRQAIRRMLGGNVSTFTTNQVLTPDHAGMVFVDATTGNVTLTLPAAALAPVNGAIGGVPSRFTFVRTDSSANAVTVQRAGTDTVEGQISRTLDKGETLILKSDGVSQWFNRVGTLLSDGKIPAGQIPLAAGYADDTGVANEYAISISNPPAAYFKGMTVRFKALNTNTGPATLRINTLGAISIKNRVDGLLIGGEIQMGVVYTATYDGADFDLLDPTDNKRATKAWANFNSIPYTTATYTTTGTVVTVTHTAHNMTTEMLVNLSFTSGSLSGTTGTYPVTFVDVNTYTVAVTSVGTTGGNVTRNLYIRAKFNISSIADNGVGDYTVTFTTPMADSNYLFMGNSYGTVPLAIRADSGPGSAPTLKTTTQCRIISQVPGSTFYDLYDVGFLILSN